jgi:gluconolactonase
MKKFLTVLMLLSSCVVSTAFAQQAPKPIVAEGATLNKLVGDYKFTEGPAVDAQGNVYFTDKPDNRIYKWSVDGTLSLFMEPTRRSNGMFFDRQGNLITCADEQNQLIKIDKDKNITVLVNDFNGKRLNGPNDLWVAPNGGIYFTDPWYKPRDGSRTAPEQEEQRVYYLSPDQKTVTVAAQGLVTPNGIIGTPDGKTLYVADIRDNKTYVYRINDDATLSDRKLFAAMDSDGMTIDSEGNVYLTNKAGVTVFNSSGTQIANIVIPEPWTANVTFGGKDKKTLFITASKSVYTLQMRVHGY